MARVELPLKEPERHIPPEGVPDDFAAFRAKTIPLARSARIPTVLTDVAAPARTIVTGLGPR